MIKAAGRNQFESGHLATDNLTPTQYHRTAWAVGSYLGLRESFIAEWQPAGGIQLSLIDMLAQSFLQFQHWMKPSVLRSQTRLHSHGYIQWQESLNVDRHSDDQGGRAVATGKFELWRYAAIADGEYEEDCRDTSRTKRSKKSSAPKNL